MPLVDLSRDRVQAFPMEHINYHGGRTAALAESASAFVSSGAPRELSGALRRLQRAVNTMPSVRKVFAELMESNRPDDVAYVRKNGLRALDLRPRRRTTGVLAMSPDAIWNAASAGKVPVAETKPQPRKRKPGEKSLIESSPEEIWNRYIYG